MVEYGIVKFFAKADDKLYGFIYVLGEYGSATGEELFFHYNSGRLITRDLEKPAFGGASEARASGPVRLRLPNEGDRIVFRRSTGPKGDKASPWGYASSWEKQVLWFQRYPNIRVVQCTQGIFQKDSEMEREVIWVGRDITDLSARYRKWKNHTGTVLDELSASNDDKVSTHYEFEIWENNTWRRCADPRSFTKPRSEA